MKPAMTRAYRRQGGIVARPPADLADWLVDDTSLTQRLRDRTHDDVRVEVIEQSRRRPLRDERRILELAPGEWALVREVVLHCAGRPWVFARTVMPNRTLRGPQRRLAHLGERPLGEALFSDPRARRGPLEVLYLQPGDPLHASIGELTEGQGLWARRSLFWFDDRPLLVGEVFLPGMRRQLRELEGRG